MNKRQKFNRIINYLNTFGENEEINELILFCQEQIGSIEKKSKRDKENYQSLLGYKWEPHLINYIDNEYYMTIYDIMDELPESITEEKLLPLIKNLVNKQLVEEVLVETDENPPRILPAYRKF